MKTQFELLTKKRFLPVFLAQFLAVFNDNIFKSALSVLIAYKIWSIGDIKPEILVSLAAGIFMMPFVLFSPLAGRLADKVDKAALIRFLKICEILILFLAVIGLYFQSVHYLIFILFLLGTQSAFFSPAKFSILPQHLPRIELIGGNALMNSGVYLAILAGTMLGTWLGGVPYGILITAGIFCLMALGGLWVSFFIPPAPPSDPDLTLNFNLPAEAYHVILYAKNLPRGVFRAVLGASWFFFTGSLYMSQLPNYTGVYLKVDHLVLTFFIAVFSVGISIGSLLNNRLLKARVEAVFVPVALFFIAAFSLDLYFASSPYQGGGLQDIKGFLSGFRGWRIVTDLLLISLAAGFYIVPLKTIIQDRTPAEYCARVLACAAMIDAALVVTAGFMAAGLFASGWEIPDLFLLIAILSLGVMLYLWPLAVSDFKERSIGDE